MPAVYYCVFVSGMSRHAPWGAFDLTHPRSPGSVLLSLMHREKKRKTKLKNKMQRRQLLGSASCYTARKQHQCKKKKIHIVMHFSWLSTSSLFGRPREGGPDREHNNHRSSLEATSETSLPDAAQGSKIPQKGLVCFYSSTVQTSLTCCLCVVLQMHRGTKHLRGS